MGKKACSILLCCALLLGLLPWTVTPAARAETERGKPLQDISAVAAGDTVWFGKQDGEALAWRVLSPAGEDKLSSGEGRVLLISRDMLGSLAFDEDGSDVWADSDAWAWCADLYKNWPDAAEKAAVAETTVEETGEYIYEIDGGGSTKLYAAPLDKDRFFFLSGLEAGGFFADDERKMGGIWWLRSRVESGTDAWKLVGIVCEEDGSILDATEPDETYGARPAFNLDASKVLLASAVNGKSGVTGTFAPLPENGTHEWKLTLTDESRTGFDVTETAATARVSGSVTLHCTGAQTGSGEYISALLYSKSGACLGCASVPLAADGTAVFTLPVGLEPGSYQLKVFNEKRSGDKASDVVGNIETVSLTVRDADAVVLAAGDTVWFGIWQQKKYTDVSEQQLELKPVAWRVLSPAGDETLPVSDAAHALLISKNTLGYGIAYGDFSTVVPNPWNLSSAKEWCDGLFTYWVPSEKDAIAETSLLDNENYQGGYGDLFEYGPALLSREHFFFLSAEEADTYFKNDDDRVAYRADECSGAALVRNSTDWWLRSPVCSAPEVQDFKKPAAGVVSGTGWVNWACTGGQTPMCYDARPAFNLDMSRVFFATAAVGGKASSDGSFVPMPENTTHEWKLTLRCDDLSDIALAETAATAFVGGRVTLHYSDAPDAEGMSVSALLYDETGERVGYASEPAETASGTAVFTLPNDLEPGAYQLKVFSELRFGDCTTDLAGNAVTVELTVLPVPSVKGGTLSGQVYELGYTVKNAPEGALLIGALYDGSGRLSEVQTVSVSGDVQDSFYMRNVKDPFSVLMLVDGRTYKPLCPAWHSGKRP